MSAAHPRGTSNSNARGSAAARRARKLQLIQDWNVGWRLVRCVFCGTHLNEQQITLDRVIPGILGGRYTRGNIRPACVTCNSTEGSRLRDLLRAGVNFFGPRFPVAPLHPYLRGLPVMGQEHLIRELLQDGRLSVPRIAREVGCSPESVRRRAA